MVFLDEFVALYPHINPMHSATTYSVNMYLIDDFVRSETRIMLAGKNKYGIVLEYLLLRDVTK